MFIDPNGNDNNYLAGFMNSDRTPIVLEYAAAAAGHDENNRPIGVDNDDDEFGRFALQGEAGDLGCLGMHMYFIRIK